MSVNTRAIKLLCPSTSKFLNFIALEESRLDVGTIARSFGLDPTTVKFNGHFVSRGIDFISSVTWKSLLAFFGSRGFSTGRNDQDAILVDGKFCKLDGEGSKASTNNRNTDTSESNHLGSKRKTRLEGLEGVNFLKKSKVDTRNADSTFSDNSGVSCKRKAWLKDLGAVNLLKKSKVEGCNSGSFSFLPDQPKQPAALLTPFQ